MKGIIFCEFLNMVEEKFGYEVVDNIIKDSNLESKGVYTAVGTYNHAEIFTLVEKLSEKVGISIEELFFYYGKYVFDIFGKGYKEMIERYPDAFNFLSRIEDTIHVEVLKLYPKAELPTIHITNRTSEKLEMVYTSQRRMYDFAEGLLVGCMEYFKEEAKVTKEFVTKDRSKVLFIIEKV